MSLFQLKDQTEEILEITKKWYSLVCDKPTKMILNICEMPFLELKFAGLVALLSIAEQPWGQQEINNCPGKWNDCQFDFYYW